ncbi:MAG: hypothetical protein ACOC3G_07860 [Phycisphaeraceae bacterium]
MTINDRLAALRDSCPRASADDLLTLAEDFADPADAVRHWTATLAARVENRDAELDDLRHRLPRERRDLRARLDAELAERDQQIAAERHRLRIVEQGIDGE